MAIINPDHLPEKVYCRNIPGMSEEMQVLSWKMKVVNVW